MQDFEVNHGGHRERMRTSLRENGMLAFAPHEVIEMLLYFAYPRGDVNAQAHALIDAFGSVNAVFEANAHEIMQKGGVSERAANVLKAFGECAHEYYNEYAETPVFINTRADMEKLVNAHSDGGAYIALLSNSRRLLYVFRLPETDCVKFIVSRTLQYDALFVLPFGNIKDTARIAEAVSCAGAELISVK